jgi:hypothetical protein
MMTYVYILLSVLVAVAEIEPGTLSVIILYANHKVTGTVLSRISSGIVLDLRQCLTVQ